MAKSQEAPMPQIPRNLRTYGISEPWAESAPPLWLIGLIAQKAKKLGTIEKLSEPTSLISIHLKLG